MDTELVKVETLRAEVAPVVARAQALVIVTPDDYLSAANGLKDIKGAIKRVDAFFDPMVRANLEATRRTNEAKATVRTPLVEAEKLYKDKQTAWTREQEAKRRAEQDRLNAIEQERARKKREQEESAARLQREKEAAALAEQQRQERLAAQAKTEAARAAAAAAAEEARRVAAAAAAKAEAREEAAASVVAAVVEVASVQPVVKGQSMRTTWKAVVTDVALVPREWMIVNDTALQAFARATKGAVPVAGVVFKSEQSLASAASK